MARSTARKRALNTLYEADEKSQSFQSLLVERISYPGAETPLPPYAIEIVQGVADHAREIDDLLNTYASWPVRRMAVVDRNILRGAVWEIMYNPDVPPAVAISEATTLARSLCDAGAPDFITGVLNTESTARHWMRVWLLRK